jgi:hypothetical protein
MKKLLIATCMFVVFASGCSDNGTKQTTTTTESSDKQADSKAQQMKDSTTILDKKLADPNSNYSPDSLK